MNLLLDVMFSPAIALQLRRREHDVVAAVEDSRLARLRDPELFAFAQTAQRAIVTNDPSGFLPLDALFRAQLRARHGIILTSDQRFPRSQAAIGRLVLALDTFLRSQPSEPQADSLVHWLQ